jgi:acetone carboxylase gamma subunit
MTILNSKKIFEDYLIKNKLSFEKNFPLGANNIDFRVNSGTLSAFCCVNEISIISDDKNKKTGAFINIRKDIQKLRSIFGNYLSSDPIVLVTMNLSHITFTGLTVVRAMYGDIEIIFNKETLKVNQGEHFSKKGKAGLTQIRNTIISGILVLDARNNHYLFKNCYAKNEIPDGFFSSIQKTFKIDIDHSTEIPRKMQNLLANIVFRSWFLGEN